MSRPVCGHCGKPYGQRNTNDERVFFNEGEPKPVYRGNLQLVKESVDPWGAHWEETKGMITKAENTKWRVVWTLWDGESYFGGYNPFCTLRCALDYARKAFAAAKAKSGIRRVS